MKGKVLIALSDYSLANLISQRLLKETYTTIISKDGEDALQKMKSQAPDIALIDLVLPKKNGYDVLIEKSFDRLITKIPFIIVSNGGFPIDMKKIPSTSSVKDYIIKAYVDPKEVVEKIDSILGNDKKVNTSSVSNPNSPKKKILWVEDDKFLSSILLKKFESSGFVVLKADDGEKALSIIENEIPDIIILDILLPGMDGFDVLQKIKMNEKNRNIPVVILSNTSKSSDLEKAKLLGVNKFLLKATVSLDRIVKEVVALSS